MWVGERWPSVLPTHFVRRRAGACERIFGADLSSCTRGGDAGPWSLLGEPSGTRTLDPLIKSPFEGPRTTTHPYVSRRTRYRHHLREIVADVRAFPCVGPNVEPRQ